MILVVGGAASGKLTFACSQGFSKDEVSCGELDGRPVVHHAERLLGKPGIRSAHSVEELADILSRKAIVTISEVGSGVVPSSADERAWREEVGCFASALAERATCVVRMVCGVPCVIKGELSTRADLAASTHATGADAAAWAEDSVVEEPRAVAERAQAVSNYEYPFFTNRACPYFPCHDDIDPAEFNCLFCYCPLYALGSRCGGRFTYTDSGVKNCTGCSIPHQGDAGTKLVREKWNAIRWLAER